MENDVIEKKEVDSKGGNKNTKQCKHCATEIPAKAKICPNCRKKQGGKMKWIIIAIIAVIIIVAVAGSGSDDVTDKVYEVGDVVEYEDMEITYISAKEYKEDNEFLQPKSGNTYYKIELEFINNGDDDITISSMLGFECYADGYAAEQTFIGEDDLSGTISKGKRIKGSLYFEVPKTANEIILEYSDNVFVDDEKLKFKVK